MTFTFISNTPNFFEPSVSSRPTLRFDFVRENQQHMVIVSINSHQMQALQSKCELIQVKTNGKGVLEVLICVFTINNHFSFFIPQRSFFMLL